MHVEYRRMTYNAVLCNCKSQQIIQDNIVLNINLEASPMFSINCSLSHLTKINVRCKSSHKVSAIPTKLLYYIELALFTKINLWVQGDIVRFYTQSVLYFPNYIDDRSLKFQ